jgi:hypothetical protein
MTQYAQYDDQGVIFAVVRSYGIAPPDFAMQLTVDDDVSLENMRVDVATRQLIPGPPLPPPVDMEAEWLLVCASKSYFLDHFVKV